MTAITTLANEALNPSFEKPTGLVELWRNLNPDPDCKDLSKYRYTGDASLTPDGIKVVENATGGSIYTDPSTSFFDPAVGEIFYAACEVLVTMDLTTRMTFGAYLGVSGSNFGNAGVLQTPAMGWVKKEAWITVTATASGGYLRALMWPVDTNIPAGQGYTFRKWQVNKVSAVGQVAPYFSGSTPGAGDYTYAWTGPANNSPSIRQAPGLGSDVTAPAAQSTVWRSSAGARHGAGFARWRLNTTAAIGINLRDVPDSPAGERTGMLMVRPSNAVTVQPRWRNKHTAATENAGPPVTLPGGQWSEVRMSGQTTLADAAPSLLLSSGHQVGWTLDIDDHYVVQGAYTGPFFTGDDPRQVTNDGEPAWFTYAWEGEPNASRSIRTTHAVDEWTRRWFDSLPSAFKEVDGETSPDVGYYPMLRYLDGPGSVAADIRKVSDDLWSGVYTDPERIPDHAVRWLAQVLGVPVQQRDIPTSDLRVYLQDITANGRPAAGNRQSIADAARRFLVGDKQVSVIPSASTPHTIIVLVKADQVPANGLAGLVADIRSTGVVPAGHNLVAKIASATWDSYEAALGDTWNEADAQRRTWTQADSLGVVIEE